MTITPTAELSELLYFRMVCIVVVLDWKTFRVIDAYVTTESEQDAGGFKCHKPRI